MMRKKKIKKEAQKKTELKDENSKNQDSKDETIEEDEFNMSLAKWKRDKNQKY